MSILCFDIGGTDIKYGVIENSKFLVKSKMSTQASLGGDNLFQRLKKVTSQFLEEYKIEGVGISVAGTVNFQEGFIISPPEDIKEFSHLDFKRFFKDTFGLPCVADNDVNCFAMAEAKSGAGKSMKSFLMMTVGTGIGGGIIINQELWRGVNFQGSEFGRMFITNKKYEAIASTSALVRQAKKSGLQIENGEEVFALYDQNHELAKELVTEFYHNLATGIANLWYIFDPEAIIIGGGISNRKQLALEIMQALEKIMVPDFYKFVNLQNAQHANDGGMIGAYYNFIGEYPDHK